MVNKCECIYISGTLNSKNILNKAQSIHQSNRLNILSKNDANYFLELILFINLQSLEDLKNIFSFVRLHKKKYIVLLFKKRNFLGILSPT